MTHQVAREPGEELRSAKAGHTGIKVRIGTPADGLPLRDVRFTRMAAATKASGRPTCRQQRGAGADERSAAHDHAASARKRGLERMVAIARRSGA